MKTVVIAAGYATRLGELTRNFPKPLLKIGNNTILGRMLDDIDQIPEIDEHIIVTNHKFAKIFADWAAEQHYSKPITIVDDGTSTNDTRLGAVCDLLMAINGEGTVVTNNSSQITHHKNEGAAITNHSSLITHHKNEGAAITNNPSLITLHKNEGAAITNHSSLITHHKNEGTAITNHSSLITNHYINDDLLVVAADNLLFFSFVDFVKFAKVKRTSCIMCHEQPSIEKLQRTGVIVVDDNMRVLNMEEKPQAPKSHWAVPPFYIYLKKDLDLIRHSVENGCGKDAPGNLAHFMVDHTTIHAWQMSADRFDIGSLDTYYEAVERFGK